MSAKAMTIRFSAEQAEALDTVASVDSQPVAEVVRCAIADYVENRRNDPVFQRSLRERINSAEQFLKKR